MVSPRNQIKKEHRHTAELAIGSVNASRHTGRLIPYHLEKDEPAEQQPLPGGYPLVEIFAPEPETVTKLIKFLMKPD